MPLVARTAMVGIPQDWSCYVKTSEELDSEFEAVWNMAVVAAQPSRNCSTR